MPTHRVTETRGVCKRCKIKYEWMAPPLLREARCPRCKGRLGLTTLRASGLRHLFETPLGAPETAKPGAVG